jgi:cytochrome b561
MSTVSRYHPLLVTLHWLLAVLIFAALAMGFFAVAPTPNSTPWKIDVLRVHMAGGALILALMVIRLGVRMMTSKPATATTGRPALDRIAPFVHYGFYILVFLIVATGFTTAILSGLNEIVFDGRGRPLPDDLSIYPTRVAHRYVALLLTSLAALHVLAVIYHQVGREDGVLRRMSFSDRRGEQGPQEVDPATHD